MTLQLSAGEIETANSISELGRLLWEETKKVEGLNNDPVMFSAMLFKRLWGNHKGFTLLWKNRLQVEADILLRSGLEASICLAANFALREKFVVLARYDLIDSIKRQIKMWRDEKVEHMVKTMEATLREELKLLPPGARPRIFDLSELAQQGGVSVLYTIYRGLSASSAHVSGMSLVQGVIGHENEGDAEPVESHDAERPFKLMTMSSATLSGCRNHSAMIGATTLQRTAEDLQIRLNDIMRLRTGTC